MSYIENGSGGSGSSSSAAEDDYSITFLYKLENGVADRSFGLNVAKLAGLPPPVLAMAAEKARGMAKDLAETRARSTTSGNNNAGAPQASDGVSREAVIQTIDDLGMCVA